MNMYDLIMKKKRGAELSCEEIEWMITGYTKGMIPDYQMSAMLMAICFNGMSTEETKNLTISMADSGDRLDLSEIRGIKIDKHSTGGVGDKTSLVLAPLVASLGVPVAKMSGRGLGHTGGTIDKLESFTGFSTSLSTEQFIRNVNDIHIAVAGQTTNLAPADKKLYALRDVTGTVDQMSLIASSIMSKKLASGADGIVLDVKCGDGAFMKDEASAIALAQEMVSIGKLAGKEMIPCIIVDADENDSAIIALLENLQRADLTFMEEAEAIFHLVQEHKYTQEQIARKLGKSQSAVANKIRLLKLPTEARKMIQDNGLTERHARALLRIADEQLQLKILKIVCEKQLNVTQTEMLIERTLERLSAPKNEKEGRIKGIVELRMFLNTVNKAIDVVKRAGVPILTQKKDRGDCIEYVIKIPRDRTRITTTL